MTPTPPHGLMLLVGLEDWLARVDIPSLPANVTRDLQVTKRTPDKLGGGLRGRVVKAVVNGAGLDPTTLQKAVTQISAAITPPSRPIRPWNVSLFLGTRDLEPQFRTWVEELSDLWEFREAGADPFVPLSAEPVPGQDPVSVDTPYASEYSNEVRRLLRELELVDAAGQRLDEWKDPADPSQVSSSRNAELQNLKALIDDLWDGSAATPAAAATRRVLATVCLEKDLNKYVRQTPLGRLLVRSEALDLAGLGDGQEAEVLVRPGLLHAALVLAFDAATAGLSPAAEPVTLSQLELVGDRVCWTCPRVTPDHTPEPLTIGLSELFNSLPFFVSTSGDTLSFSLPLVH